jgi:hypothetical protein
LSHRKIAVLVFFFVLFLTSLLVLKYVPLKYVEIRYSTENELSPGSSMGMWCCRKCFRDDIVTGSYTANGTMRISICVLTERERASGFLEGEIVVWSDENTTGSFTIRADNEEKYYFLIKNPFNSTECYPPTAVTIEWKVSGWTTYL